MQHRFARLLSERATQRLAIDGDQLAAGRFVNRLRPLKQTGCELFPAQQAEDAPKRIVRGNALGQFQKCFEPIVPEFAEGFQIRPATPDGRLR